jgi:bacterioferritin
MMDEYNEEMANVAKIINRILELGGTPTTLKAASYPAIYTEAESQLRNECQEQFEGLEQLEQMIQATELDIVTKDFFVDYMKEETAHATWLKQQVDLIESIGLQNYLAKQL